MSEVHPEYKLGRLQPTAVRAALRARDILRVTPGHPSLVDHLSLVPAWMLGGNSEWGTCGPTFVANNVVMVWKYLLNEDVTVSDEAVFDLYRRSGNPNFDPATGADDNGVEMQVMLKGLLDGGIDITHADGRVENVKPVAFALVDLGDFDEVRAATSIFGGVGFGLDLEVAQQRQTDAGGPWDYSPSGQWGGHATLGGAYSSQSGAHQTDEKLVTWARVLGTTDQFMAHQLGECWAVIWPAHFGSQAFQEGVDRAALAAAFKVLTGRDLPVPDPVPTPIPPTPEPTPAPPPAPPPSPNPTPRPDDWRRFLKEALGKLREAITEIERLLDA